MAQSRHADDRGPPRDRKLEMDGGHVRLVLALAYAAAFATYHIAVALSAG